MREQLEVLRAAAMAELGDGASAEQIEAVRVRVLGRGGSSSRMIRRISSCAAFLNRSLLNGVVPVSSSYRSTPSE